MNRRAVRQCTAEGTTQPRKKRIGSRLKLSHITSIAMFADHPRNLASVRKIETLPSLRRCHFPSLAIGNIFDFFIRRKLWDNQETVKSPIVYENQAQRTLFASERGMKFNMIIHSLKKIEPYIYIYIKTYQIIRRVYFIYRKTLAKKHDMKNQNPVH